MKTKLSTNSIVKLILMEVVVVLIYFIGIGALIASITEFFSWPYIEVPAPENAFWGDTEYMLDPVQAEYARNIAFGVIVLLQVVAASFFLNNIRYWLCSLVPQVVLFSLIWLPWSNSDRFVTWQEYVSTSFLTDYWLSVITILAAQIIGVLINFLVRWIARKLRIRLLIRKINALLRSVYVKNPILVGNIIRLIIMTTIVVVLQSNFFFEIFVVALLLVGRLLFKDFILTEMILYGAMAFLELVGASILLTNIKYWLYSIVPQLAVYTLWWLFYGTRSFVECGVMMLAIFAIQALGVLINYLIRKAKARKQPALVV